MAKLKMKCIELLAPLEQSKEIIDCLQRMGTVELTDCEESESLCKLSTGVTVSTFERYLAAAESAQKTLDKYAPQKKGLMQSLMSSFGGRKELEVSEYLKKADEADEILRECYRINSLEADMQSRIRPLYGTGCHIYICHQRDRYGRHIRKRNTTEVYGYARLDEPVCGFTGR